MSRNYTVTIRNDKKKEKRHKKGRGLFKFLLLLAILGGAVFAGGYYLKKYAQSCTGDSCNPLLKPILNTIEPKLIQEDGLTNILIVGIDTRGENSGLMNTDTMIILTINHNDGTATMTSTPRDLWVRYETPNGNTVATKINSAYAVGEMQEKGKGIETLSNVLEMVTGLKIHYYVKFTLEGFTDLIDTLGGIDIEVASKYKDAYPESELPPALKSSCVPFYHDGKYCIFVFEAGTQHLDADHALIYARSRLMSPLGDFDRARRQQQVINAVKDKVLSTSTLLDPGKLWDIYNIIKNNIESSPFTINDIRAALSLKDKIDTDHIGSVVLDPNLGSFGQYIKRGPDIPSMGYYIIANDLTYQPIHDLIQKIIKSPQIWNEHPIVSIYNATGNKTLPEDYAKKLNDSNSLFNIRQTNKVITNPNGLYTGIKIYKFTKDDKSASEDFLKEFFGVSEVISDITDGTKALNGEDFVIIIGTPEVTTEPTGN